MPSAPNADSPFMDSRLQATFGVKAPGSPSSAGKPGVQAADVSFPAPPAPASAPAGRPSATPTPTPIVAPPPPPQSGEMWPDAHAKVAAPATPPQSGEMRPDASGGQPTSQAPAGMVPAVQPPVPSVVAGVTALNQPELVLTPEGAQRYRESVIRTREALGPMPNVFRNAGMPEMPVEPGRPNYNPFTGSWSN